MTIKNLLNLSGKSAIVTGAGNGIGKASALLLAQAGANVVVSDRNLADAEQVANDIIKLNHRAIAVECDVSQDEQLVHLTERCLEEFGGINILINNVGIGGGGREDPLKITVDYFANVFKVNLFSAWRLCQLVAPHMKISGYGSIVNISSMGSINTSPAMSAYASSKAAINHMTANLAYDFGPDVRINAVAPGAIETNALKSVLTDEIEARMLSHTPIRRLGQASDIAQAVLFLASPMSSWIDGQTLFINGGGVQTLD